MQYVSVKDIAKKFGISARRVQTLCEQQRIAGAVMVSGVWLIPQDAKKPSDARIKTEKKNAANSSEQNESLLSLKQACELLSISQATGRNWVKSGKLKPHNPKHSRYRFLKADILQLQRELLEGKNAKLRSRRNKKYISGKQTYAGYIENEDCIRVVKQIVDTCHTIGEQPYLLRLVLAEYALQLICSAKRIATKQPNQLLAAYCNSELSVGIYQPLIADFIKDIPDIAKRIAEYEHLFRFTLSYVKGQDCLGLLYLSLREINERKDTGAYYTPISVVKTVVDELVAERLLDHSKTICDPCCGTGNFLLYASEYQPDIHSIYGQDLDELSVRIARVNLCLACEIDDVAVLYRNITCEDSLKESQRGNYDIILGNPPWGYRYSAEYLKEIAPFYQTVSKSGAESFSLFLEHALQQCNRNGIVAFLLPEALCTVKNHQPIRKILMQESRFISVHYLDNIFSGVQCPAIILVMQKTTKPFTVKGMKVKTQKQSFTIQSEREVTSELFSFTMTDSEHEILQTMQSCENVVYLKDNAEFALGIVTGDNAQYLLTQPKGNAEPIIKGSDLALFMIQPAQHYIVFQPQSFQQVAKEEYYRAKEKLFYRFICERLVFAYDNSGLFSLNSCNIVIPKVKGLDMRYIIAILNSDCMQFYFAKRFQSIKVLRSHIEQLPIPFLESQKQQYFIKQVEKIRQAKEKTEKLQLFAALNEEVANLFGLTKAQREIIANTVTNSAKYL
jgi:predicted RNA methylase